MAQRNMSPTKCPMPSLAPDYRNKVFEEVATGYTYEMAVEEARRCLHCKNKPCVTACPVQIDIPAFIEKVANEDMEGAFEILNKQSSLPAVCGRVCPQETQCESKCVRGIKGEPVGIGRLERFVADWHREHNAEKPVPPASNGHKVAVIGAGPAGLTCAGDLARMGYKVTIYEALHVAGGVLSYGIPEFRLPKAIVNSEVDNLRALGVDIETDMVIGKVLTIDELFDDMGFEAVFIGSGAGLPRFMGIPGESLKGVYSANEFLTRINLMKAYLHDSKTPIRPATASPSSAAATSPWTPRAAQSAWAPRRSTSSTAAVCRSCRPAARKSSTPRKRASSSRRSPTRSRCSATTTPRIRAIRATARSSA